MWWLDCFPRNQMGTTSCGSNNRGQVLRLLKSAAHGIGMEKCAQNKGVMKEVLLWSIGAVSQKYFISLPPTAQLNVKAQRCHFVI